MHRPAARCGKSSCKAGTQPAGCWMGNGDNQAKWSPPHKGTEASMRSAPASTPDWQRKGRCSELRSVPSLWPIQAPPLSHLQDSSVGLVWGNLTNFCFALAIQHCQGSHQSLRTPRPSLPELPPARGPQGIVPCGGGFSETWERVMTVPGMLTLGDFSGGNHPHTAKTSEHNKIEYLWKVS